MFGYQTINCNAFIHSKKKYSTTLLRCRVCVVNDRWLCEWSNEWTKKITFIYRDRITRSSTAGLPTYLPILYSRIFTVGWRKLQFDSYRYSYIVSCPTYYLIQREIKTRVLPLLYISYLYTYASYTYIAHAAVWHRYIYTAALLLLFTCRRSICYNIFDVFFFIIVILRKFSPIFK